MKLKILRFNRDQDYHVCEDEHGIKHFYDIMIASKFPEGTTPESVVGKTIETLEELITPYISIVNDFYEVSE